MINHKNNSGIIPNFVSAEELKKWVSIMEQFEETIFYQPVTRENIGTCKGVDEKNKKGYLLFDRAILKKIRKHFNQDTKLNFSHYADSTIPIKTHVDVWDKPPYISCLIPVSVDYDINLCNRASTIVNGVEYKWCHGDLIWWDSTLPHSSNDFTLTNTSKQGIVIHTYV